MLERPLLVAPVPDLSLVAPEPLATHSAGGLGRALIVVLLGLVLVLLVHEARWWCRWCTQLSGGKAGACGSAVVLLVHAA